jgi:hypothetical protein
MTLRPAARQTWTYPGVGTVTLVRRADSGLTPGWDCTGGAEGWLPEALLLEHGERVTTDADPVADDTHPDLSRRGAFACHSHDGLVGVYAAATLTPTGAREAARRLNLAADAAEAQTNGSA